MIPIQSPSLQSSPETLEQPACPLCGATEPGERHEKVYDFSPFAVARCRRCRLWYLSPRLVEPVMQASYADDAYFEGGEAGYSSYQAQEATLRPTFRRFLAELARRGMAGGRLLEVGCAYGFFLDEAQGVFTHRTGTDYSAAALAKAAGRADRLLLGGAEQLAADERFDCIACIHVIEHIYDPVAFLQTLTRHLRPGGWLVLATPDMGSFWRPLLRYRWPFFKIPEHVTYFDRRTLAALLGRAGLEAVQTLPYASAFSLELIGEKLGRPLPAAWKDRQLWLPATTIAAAGRKPDAPESPERLAQTRS
jgi:2-polyprenyl-3-methyl-5-hydroxy-6-metoxy-1,4-benzoquinol methylase